jgi:DNA-binding response OmpR family regulator
MVGLLGLLSIKVRYVRVRLKKAGRQVKVVVVDDNELYVQTLKLLLSRAGYEVKVATGINAAFILAIREQPQLLITDYNLADGTGLELVERLAQIDKPGQSHYILMSGRSAENWRPLCAESQANKRIIGFLQKPFTFKELQALLTRLAQLIQMQNTSLGMFQTERGQG